MLVLLTVLTEVSIFRLPGNPSTLLIIPLVLRTVVPWAKLVSFQFLSDLKKAVTQCDSRILLSLFLFMVSTPEALLCFFSVEI